MVGSRANGREHVPIHTRIQTGRGKMTTDFWNSECEAAMEEALAKANDCSMGLGASVWGTDVAAAKEIASRMESGSVWVNRHGAIQPDAPFGGVKQSGFGVEFGIEGLKELTTIQTVFA